MNNSQEYKSSIYEQESPVAHFRGVIYHSFTRFFNVQLPPANIVWSHIKVFTVLLTVV